MQLLHFTEKGIYCPKADVYLDPHKPVEKAVISHGHSDHARPGHLKYLVPEPAAPVINYRLPNNNIQTAKFGEKTSINGVKFSFHPAGHIIGSSQIRVEYKGEVWVFSGDYKTETDGISENFELVPCNTFITESTFALPVYVWPPQSQIFEGINNWWRENKHKGFVSIIACYSLGKAQRIIANVDTIIGSIFTHGAIENINSIIRAQGVALPQTKRYHEGIDQAQLDGALILAPPSAINSSWIKHFKHSNISYCSGWMAIRGIRRRRGIQKGFVLSDHVDWPSINNVILATGAERVYATHGYTDIFIRWLNEKGIEGHVGKTEFSDEFENELEEKEQA